MKNTLFIAGFLIASFTSMWAQKEVVKEYDRSYTNLKNKTLIIDNKYGSVDVHDWDKSEISVHVEVVTRAASESKAKTIQEKIKINFTESGSEISVITEIEDMVNDLWDIIGNKNEFEINYTVNMPANLPLNLTNKYGAVFINKLTATSIINVKYGSLKANSILHDKTKPYTEIILGYSDGDIEECQWIKMYVKYSDLEINHSRALIMETKYSDVEINQASSIVTESKYDDYKIGQLVNLVVDAGYSDFKIGKLTGKLKSDSKYSDVYIKSIPANFQSIIIDNKYGDYHLAIAEGASYRISASAKYANIVIPRGGSISNIEESNEQTVKGSVGNSSSESFVEIETSYGDIKLVD